MLKLWINIFVLLLCFSAASGQNKKSDSDIALLRDNHFGNEKFKEREVKFLFHDRRDMSLFVRYNPLTLAFGGLLYGYQKLISPQISSKCSYNPTCSQFSLAAIQYFGVIKGIALSADRLTRCSPLGGRDISFTDLNEAEKKVKNKPEKYKLKSGD